MALIVSHCAVTGFKVKDRLNPWTWIEIYTCRAAKKFLMNTTELKEGREMHLRATLLLFTQYVKTKKK